MSNEKPTYVPPTKRVELFKDYAVFKEFVEAGPCPFEIWKMSNESPTGSSWWAIVCVYGS